MVMNTLGMLRLDFMSTERSRQELNENEAELIAARVCKSLDWPLLRPIKVLSRPMCWEIITNCDARGCNARISVDKQTRTILSAAFAPR